MEWFRWWHGSSTDPKFQMVAKECDLPLSSVLGLWATLLEQASLSGKRGSFEVDHEVLSFQLGIDTVTPCNAMKRRGLLHETDGMFHVANWEKRQPKRERDDNSAERVRALRAKKKQLLSGNENHVTPCNANEAQETPRGEERREEKSTIGVRENSSGSSTKAGDVCKALVAAGVTGVNPSHPNLVALLESGATLQEFTDAANESTKKTFAYILGVVKGRRADASAAPAKPRKANGAPVFDLAKGAANEHPELVGLVGADRMKKLADLRWRGAL